MTDSGHTNSTQGTLSASGEDLRAREAIHNIRRNIQEKKRLLRVLKFRSILGVAAGMLAPLSLLSGIAVSVELNRRDLGSVAGTATAIWLPLLLSSIVVLIWLAGSDVTVTSANNTELIVDREDLERDLAILLDQLHFLSARTHSSVTEQRALYRENAHEVIDDYAALSRRYRRRHNSLHALITLGSASIAAVAALDPGLNWQKKVIIGISFVVTCASGFSGYYKFRERSYFLQQSADAIEEELNAALLGVGEYSNFSPHQNEELLAHFAQRVESLRNEQRRRQQQLDQPAEQSTSTQQPQQ
ncbi:SLATT domain-containing protein [Streptomyces sp. NPDC018031]|uniref:SLATT domain-containing protein n=1 Tax=Streptomyces sp. NPDC018031 TaxID=3365033 RepID=UPI00379A04A8